MQVSIRVHSHVIILTLVILILVILTCLYALNQSVFFFSHVIMVRVIYETKNVFLESNLPD